MIERPSEIVFLGGFIVGTAVRFVYAGRIGRRVAETHGRAILDRALTLVSGLCLMVVPPVYLFTPWLDFADYRSPAWAVWLGGPVFVLAIWLLRRAHADLGRYWSPGAVLWEDHVLVAAGVYSRIRHPMYAAHWLWAVAQALLLGNWIAGPCLFVTFIPLYILRVRREEAALARRFGEEYRAYAGATGRLLPRFPGRGPDGG